MSAKRSSSRRQFLKGQAAADALADLVDGSLKDSGLAEGRGGLPPVRADSYLVEFGRRAMACQFEIFVNAGQYPRATEAALAALDLVDELEEQLTVYRPSSEVMEINRSAAAGPVVVERRLFELLQFSQALFDETGGAFDITSGPLSKVWGFYRRQGAIPDEQALAGALAQVGSQHLRLDADEQTIRFEREGMELNLGSIGKGYALDRAAELLQEMGVDEFLLHGGQSSVLARGSRGPQEPQKGWLVAIGDPLRPGKPIAQVRLRDRALGTSGSGVQFFRHGGRRYGHILDPRTGWPAEGVFSASVAAPTAAEADALATACYVLGPERSLEIFGQRPELGLLVISAGSGPGGVRIDSSGFNGDDLTLLNQV